MLNINDQGGRVPAPPLSRSVKGHSLALIAAFQVPILIWLVSAYLLATQVFSLPLVPALAVAAGFGWLVFLIECVVVAAPLHWGTIVVRLVLTVLMSALGAVAVDLALFRQDIESLLRDEDVAALKLEQATEVRRRESLIAQAKADWEQALRRHEAEFQGTGGTRTRGCGPICTRLGRHAEERHAELMQAQGELKAYEAQAAQEVQARRQSDEPVARSGLLKRLAALHTFMTRHPEALVAWAGLFLAVMVAESSVVLAKLARGRPLEERLQMLRESIMYQRARHYHQAMTRTSLTSETHRGRRMNP